MTDNATSELPSAMSASIVPPHIDNSTVAPPAGFPVPRHIQIGVTILAVTVIILARIGNRLVIYIVFTVNHMRSSTNTLVANMAVADLLMTIDIPYILKLVYVWDHWFGTLWALWARIMQVLSLSSSGIPSRLSVHFSGDFSRSKFWHSISNEDDHDSKR